MAEPTWWSWTTTKTGKSVPGSARQFRTESQALAYAVAAHREGDSGAALTAWIMSDTGTQAAKRRSVMFLDDMGRPQEFCGDQQEVIDNILASIERTEIRTESE